MHRLPATVLAGLALSGSLVGLAPAAPAAADSTCDDSAHPITTSEALDLVVGIKRAQAGDLAVYTHRGCSVSSAVAVITSPHETFRVTLAKDGSDDDTLDTAWRGTLRLKPSELRNSDAGIWTVRYRVRSASAATVESVTAKGHVRRATRAAFDAGPEPVRNNRLTFTGSLERADWNSHHYTPIRRRVVVQTHDRVDDSLTVDVVTVTTKKDGTFRRTVAFPGAGPYWVSFSGGRVAAPTTSRADRVAAP